MFSMETCIAFVEIWNFNWPNGALFFANTKYEPQSVNHYNT